MGFLLWGPWGVPTAEPPEGAAGFGGSISRAVGSPWEAPRCPGQESLGRPGTPLHTQSRPFEPSLSLCFYPLMIPSLRAQHFSMTGVGAFTGVWSPF